MALKITLNTADIPNIANVIAALPSGTTYDHVRLCGSPTGTVTLANATDAVHLATHLIDPTKPAGHQKLLNES